jgi:hypothetical protein
LITSTNKDGDMPTATLSMSRKPTTSDLAAASICIVDKHFQK